MSLLLIKPVLTCEMCDLGDATLHKQHIIYIYIYICVCMSLWCMLGVGGLDCSIVGVCGCLGGCGCGCLDPLFTGIQEIKQ